ncbi:MAG: hypothetical protein AB9903_09415 [Vulcanimicrobiota bacterium]
MQKAVRIISAALNTVALVAVTALLLHYCVMNNLSFADLAVQNATVILGFLCIRVDWICRLAADEEVLRCHDEKLL